jgi:asparagine synthetase B (glutamine-hydrolysing)
LERPAVIEGYIDLFRQAVSRLAHGQSAIALSGGCDSRHILLELHRQKKLPDYAMTVAIPGRPTEPEIAAELARRVGIQHVVVHPRLADCVADEIWKNEVTNFTTVSHGWFACVGRNRDERDWWDGIAGDVLSAGLFLERWNLQLFRDNRLDELADRLVEKGNVPYFRDQSCFPREPVVEEVRAELSRHTEAPNPVGSYYFWNRTRVDIAAAAFALLRPQGQRTLAPYLDPDLWEFLSSIPAEMMLDHQLHVEAVRLAYPEFASVPYFHKKVPIGSGLQRRKTLELLRYLLMHGRADREHWVLNLGRNLVNLLHSRRLVEIGWAFPLTIYMTEVRKLAKAGR